MTVSYGGSNITFDDGSTVSSGWTGMKNRIINGGMVIDQRNGGSIAYSNTSIGNAYGVDRFQVNMSSDATVACQQTTDAPAGFKNSLKLSVTAADTSIGSNQYVQMFQVIEGNNIADLNWGTANAATVTVSFWVKSNIAGKYPVRLVNANGSRSFTFYTTINQSNTWEYKTKVVPGPTNGTFDSTNGVGIALGFSFGAGTFFAGATEDVWNTTASYQNSHMTPLVYWIGSVGNEFFITGVQVERGSTASSFEYRSYTTEMQLCQRYYQKITAQNSYSHFGVGVGYSGTAIRFPFHLKTTMRVAPSSLDIYGATQFLIEREAGAAQTSTAVALTANGNDNIAQIVVTPASSMSTGGAGFNLYSNATTDCYLGFGAEL